ncbi:MAG: uroporphyrinogen-III C-methyltransferase [Gammaproteobacteria bacterium]|nr:uroporphyrinogen-III C-methyltransferase [Gammaproteobacteria bacterium]
MLPFGAVPEEYILEEEMKRVDAEVEEAEILGAEVIDARQPQRSDKRSGLALLLVLIALALAGVGALYSFQAREVFSSDIAAIRAGLEAMRVQTDDIDQRLKTAHGSFATQAQQLLEQQRVLAEQQQALTNHRQLLQERDAKLEREREQLSQVGQEIRETMQSLHRRIGGDDSYWMAEEAAYLMQVAHHRLQLEWDLRTAIRALESADARLRDSGYPGWVQVRELLALEISQLKGIELADIEGVALQLSILAAGVNQLKLLGSELPAAATSEPEVLQRTAPEERSLKTLGRDLWEGFKSIIVVRHHGQPVSALLPSDQQLLIQQHLSLQLEAARVSLLRGSQALFSTSLQNAIRLLHEHVDLDDTRSKAYLEQLTAYSKLQIRPQLPDISASLIALREQIKTLGADR